MQASVDSRRLVNPTKRDRMMGRLLPFAFAGIISTHNFDPASAATLPILSLFNTGVATNDANGNPATLIGDGAPDPHYAITSSPDGSGQAAVTIQGAYPFGYWKADSTTSKWISPHANENSVNGGAQANQVGSTSMKRLLT